MFNPEKFNWRVFHSKEKIPTHVSIWLLDSMSLTHKLKVKYEEFEVNVISQKESMPYKCEHLLLNSTENQGIIVREVELLGNQKPVVNARSLIPVTEDTIDILKIGSRPLGEILFDDPEIERGHLEVGSYQKSWARRSTFTIGKTNLLVTEVFLESLYA
jgi:chorismate--pyruvate lyase